MRSFGTPGYLLGDARFEVRVVYTAFLLFVLVGMATMASFQLIHVGPRPAQIAAYWRGGDRGGAMLFPKTLREMIELTHFHAFTMGIVYLVLAHLFLATTASEAFKRAMVIVGFVGSAGRHAWGLAHPLRVGGLRLAAGGLLGGRMDGVRGLHRLAAARDVGAG